MTTLKSPTDTEELQRWWSESVPRTQHPLEDPSKWSIDGWVLDGSGTDTRLCAMIQGEFRECELIQAEASRSEAETTVPSGTYRTFTRTFILADAGQGTL
jgi:nuclear RNA export factor